ncbi:MAG: CehA/McbA family metallohydrolase [Thermoplasmata archaeon]|nr:CehA/McbA family metallohydrolase [Thermoplasmata archaeon]
MKIDLHVHSNYSPDGKLTPLEILRILKSRGIDGVAITDHNSIKGSLSAIDESKETGMLLIRGTEISSEEGHIAALGVGQDVERGLSPEETIDKIHALGGIAVAVHPFRLSTGVGSNVIRRCRFDAIETLNSWTTRRRNIKASKLADELKIPKTAGSDGHKDYDIGKAYVVIEDCDTEERAIEMISKGEAMIVGESRRPYNLLIDTVEMTLDWAKRGFKRL